MVREMASAFFGFREVILNIFPYFLCAAGGHWDRFYSFIVLQFFLMLVFISNEMIILTFMDYVNINKFHRM